MSSPVKEAITSLAQNGFTEIIERSKGGIKAFNPNTSTEALFVQTGNNGWHKGIGPIFSAEDEIDTVWVPDDGEPWLYKMTQADYHVQFGPGYTNFQSDQIG